MNTTRRGILMTVIAALALSVAGIVVVLRYEMFPQPSRRAGLTSAGFLSDTFLLRDFRSKRASSWNRTGKNQDFLAIPAGETRPLLLADGAGCIRHFYWAYIEGEEAKRHNLFRGVILRAFWDGAEAPSIEVPLGDLFGVSNGQVRPIKSLAFTTNPGHAMSDRSWGFNCYLPMPFARGARIELENQTDQTARVWFHIDYQLYEDSSAIPADAGRLHAQWNRANPTEGVPFPKGPDPRNLTNRWQLENLSGKDNYEILDVEGDGQLAGYFLTVVNIQGDPWTWWGEGDDMVFIDGEGFPPSIHGTGSEEIFGGGACPAIEYTGPYTGFHRVENLGGEQWLGTNGMYRFYLTDPLRFRKSIRVTIEHGHGNNKSNDYSSVAFWYQRGVNASLPPLAPLAERRCTNTN